jgi:hypothetical protein
MLVMAGLVGVKVTYIDLCLLPLEIALLALLLYCL